MSMDKPSASTGKAHVESGSEALSQQSNQHEAWYQKVERELELTADGVVGGIKNGASELIHNPTQALVDVAAPVAFTLAMRTPGAARLPLELLGAASTGYFGYQVYKGVDASMPAFEDAWKSNANFDKDKSTLEANLGPLAFNGALMGVAGIGTSKFLDAFSAPKTYAFETGAESHSFKPVLASDLSGTFDSMHAFPEVAPISLDPAKFTAAFGRVEPITTSTASDSVISNFSQVSGELSRGAQLNSFEAMQELHERGVNTILDLRLPGLGAMKERMWARKLGMDYINKPLVVPTVSRMNSIMSDVHSSDTGNVYVHCRYGSDRTGTVVGTYRRQTGWDWDSTWKEMRDFGFKPFLYNMKDFVRGVDPMQPSSQQLH